MAAAGPGGLWLYSRCSGARGPRTRRSLSRSSRPSASSFSTHGRSWSGIASIAKQAGSDGGDDGALRNRLGTKLARYFAQPKFANAGEAMHELSATIDEIASDPAAVAAGRTTMKLFERALDGYCRTLDPYSNYIDEETARHSEETRKLDYVGDRPHGPREQTRFSRFPFSCRTRRPRRRPQRRRVAGNRSRSGAAAHLLEVSDRLTGTPTAGCN